MRLRAKRTSAIGTRCMKPSGFVFVITPATQLCSSAISLFWRSRLRLCHCRNVIARAPVTASIQRTMTAAPGMIAVIRPKTLCRLTILFCPIQQLQRGTVAKRKTAGALLAGRSGRPVSVRKFFSYPDCSGRSGGCPVQYRILRQRPGCRHNLVMWSAQPSVPRGWRRRPSRKWRADGCALC